ncbi:MAG TPA: lecithin retinol acyltransferase family protein [Gammaproteobacteria bacterium]|nr:lecithin retinol acyltransferase family protein [Gammaproteobacteria bacterium]
MRSSQGQRIQQAAIRRMEDGELPPLGAHLLTPRRGYFHHGIHVGAGRVVHYSARACSLIRRPVEDVSIPVFSKGRGIWLREPAPGSYQSAEIIRRARSRLGENRYRLLTNNCEHFSEWCVCGQHRSAQVEALLEAPKRLWNGPARVLAAVVRASAHFHREITPRFEHAHSARRRARELHLKTRVPPSMSVAGAIPRPLRRHGCATAALDSLSPCNPH